MKPLAADVPYRASPRDPTATRGFAIFAWGVLGYNVLVILWGALVRATKSGAGCGGHWPDCNGQILPQLSQIATVIEFTHRVMSGLALVAVVMLFAWALKTYTPNHPARRWANLSLLFIITEALIGAALVLFGYVAGDESVGRVYWLGTHLVNTFLLLASLALTSWTAELPTPTGTPKIGLRGSVPWFGPAAGLVLVAMAGAVTALGDTLFPSHSLAEGIAQDFMGTAHFLIRLRVIHPMLAVLVSCYVGFLAAQALFAKKKGSLHKLASALLALLAAQLLAGVLTILWQAPVAMQLVHLFLADALWIVVVLFTREQVYRFSQVPTSHS